MTPDPRTRQLMRLIESALDSRLDDIEKSINELKESLSRMDRREEGKAFEKRMIERSFHYSGGDGR